MVDGLKGFPEAIRSAVPEAAVQTCIVHPMRHAFKLCSHKDRCALAAAMKAIYKAPGLEATTESLEEWKPGARDTAIGSSWWWNWEDFIRLFAFAPEIRWLMATTNASDSLNRNLRKSLNTRGHFPYDQAASRFLYLAIRNVGAKR